METSLTYLQCNILPCNEALSETLEVERYLQQTDLISTTDCETPHITSTTKTTKLLASEGLHLQDQIKVNGTHAQMVQMFQSVSLPSCLKDFHWTCPMAVYSVNADAFYALPDNYPKPFCSILHSTL